MHIELITKEDLGEFRAAIVADVAVLLKQHAQATQPVSFETKGMTYKPLFKIKEICALFSISKPTVYEWIKDGKLKPKRIKSRVFFLWEDVQVLWKGG